MPCASVSEKPTRASAEYLNGGLRSVRRPSSRVMPPMLLLALSLHQLVTRRLRRAGDRPEDLDRIGGLEDLPHDEADDRARICLPVEGGRPRVGTCARLRV